MTAYDLCVEDCQQEICIEGPVAPVFKAGVSDAECERVLEDCFAGCREQCRLESGDERP